MKLSLLFWPGFLALSPPASAQESQAVFDSAVVTLDTFDPPYKLALDFDGDGDLDLLGMSHYSSDSSSKGAHELALYVNQGDGTLARVWYEKRLDTVEKAAPAFVARGKLVAGGRDQFVYTWGHQVRIYDWDPATSQAVLLGTSPNTSPAVDVTAADFDGDGRDNVAVLETDRVQVHVLHSGGVIEFVDVPVAAGKWTRLLPIDTDGDGASELLLFGMKGFELREFPHAPHQNIRPIGGPLAVHMPMPAVGDIDGDGDQDAVVFGMMSYQVLRNEHGVLRVEAPVMGGPATNLADVDLDGDLDGVCCSGGDGGPLPVPNNFVSAFEISLNDGTGRFAKAFSIDAIGSKGIAGVIDLDGDGDRELISGRVIYYAHGPIVASSPELVPANPKELSVVDLDEDGDLDLGVGLDGLEENLGDGTTRAAHARFPKLPEPQRYDGPGIPGDFDADGDQDLLVDKWADATSYLGVYLLENTGAAVFEERHLAFQPAAPLSNVNFVVSDTIQVRDVDQDGLADLIMPPDWTGRIYWNDGAAGFSKSFWNEPVCAVADIDGDGVLDLVCAGVGVLGVHRGLGGRSFGPLQSAWPGYLYPPTFYATIDRLAVADLTGDRALDIAFVDRERRELLLFVGSPGSLAFTLQLPSFQPRPAWADDFPDGSQIGNRVFAPDLDGDGSAELVVTPTGFYAWPDLQTAAVLKRTGSSWSWEKQMLNPRAFVDADGDGDLDSIGGRVTPGRTIEGTAAGRRVQFGAGLAGLDALAPKLGASGPFRVGETVTLRISCGLGGANATLVQGRTRSEAVIGGVPIYVDPSDAHYQVTPLVLDGASGASGAGHATVTFVVQPAELGVTTYYQVLVADPAAPGGTSASNGLELEFGQLP